MKLWDFIVNWIYIRLFKSFVDSKTQQKIKDLELAVKTLREDRNSRFQACDYLRHENTVLLRELRQVKGNEFLTVDDVVGRHPLPPDMEFLRNNK